MEETFFFGTFCGITNKGDGLQLQFTFFFLLNTFALGFFFHLTFSLYLFFLGRSIITYDRNLNCIRTDLRI